MEHYNVNERVIKSILLNDKICPFFSCPNYVDDGYGTMESMGIVEMTGIIIDIL
jgi:hypothetical protein